MKQRKLIIGLLVTLAVAVSGFTFAFWATGLDGDSNEIASHTVEIGSAQQATSTVSVTPDSIGDVILVPAGRTGESIEAPAGFTLVETVSFTFDVSWNEDVDAGDLANFAGAIGDLTVTVDNKLINSSGTYSALVVTTDDAPATITEGAAAITITITLTLTEPADATAYAAIAGQNITFDVTFAVVPQ